MRTDDQIKAEIIEQLDWEPGIDAGKITISVENGIVRLSGNVNSYYQKITAENTVRMIAGVKAIADDVQIGVIPSDDSSDVDIAAAVAETLANHRHIDERKIQIVVDKGIVTLQGSVCHNFERRAAEEMIAPLKGVNRINNYIVVQPSIHPVEIKNNIEQYLTRNAALDPDKIRIEVIVDKVILTGFVHSLAEGDEVEFAAWATPGVAEVDNRLILEEKDTGTD